MTHVKAYVINYVCIFDADTASGSLHTKNGKEEKGQHSSFWQLHYKVFVAFKTNDCFFPIFLQGEKILLRYNLRQSTRSFQRMLTTNKNISSILIIMLCLLCQLMIHYPNQVLHYKWFCTVFMGLQALKSREASLFLQPFVCLNTRKQSCRECVVYYMVIYFQSSGTFVI